MASGGWTRVWLRRGVAAVLVVSVAAVVAGCSDGEGGGREDASTDAGPTTTSASTTTAPRRAERPDGPAAELTEIEAPGVPFMGSAVDAEVPAGYEEHEYVAAGTATSYAPQGELSGDGRWTLAPDGTADYRTRVVVRRPADPDDFSGTVVVEWLNVSGGLDANPVYSNVAGEIVRSGDAWVGVSAQLIGVEGGPVLVAVPGAEQVVGKGLKVLRPERYGSLVHPGDGFSFDIYTQVARAVLDGAPLDAEPTTLVAAGQSQSAIALTTYYDGMQPLTNMFDGYLIHSRAYAALPLVGPGEYADLTRALTVAPRPTLFRDDLGVPVLELQAESDVTGVLNSVAARQADTDGFRLWEVAGTAHADRHLIGVVSDGIDCGGPINDGPMHVVAKAALSQLKRWVADGEPPAEQPRLQTDGGEEGAPVTIARDADGIALGGIRTPSVDVPVDVQTGEPGSDSLLICTLLGGTRPLPPPSPIERYGSRDDYRRAYEAAVDAAVEAGVVLEADRDAVMAYARPDRVDG